MNWLFCKHEWEVVTEQILPAPLETENITNLINSFKSIPVTTMEKLAVQTHICIMKCKKCGALRHFTTRSVPTY